MSKFHNSEDGPRPCHANVKACPVGGDHYDSLETAQKAYEDEMSKSVGIFNKLMTKKDPNTAHIREAEKRIKASEKDLKARDARQGKDTVIHQLYREGITDDDLKKVMELELNNREAGIGYLSTSEGSDMIVGVTYTGDYRAEEEWGLAHISKSLAEGTFKKDDVRFFEKDGKGYLLIKGERSYNFEEDAKNSLKTADNRFSNYVDYDERSKQFSLERKSVAQLRSEFKGKIKPLPTKKSDLINAVLDLERPKDFVKHPQGEFHLGNALAIVSDNPAMIATMRHAKDAHDNGSLRVGSSSNPFSNGVVFYDERDISRDDKINLIKSEEATKAAVDYISETEKKLKENGRVYANSPRVGPELKDVRDSKYWLNYSPKNHKQIFGWFNKDDLDKIANGDFSPWEEQENNKNKR